MTKLPPEIEKLRHEACQKYITEWTSKQSAFYNNETLIMSRHFNPGFNAGFASFRDSEIMKEMVDALEKVCKRNDIEEAVLDYYGDCSMAVDKFRKWVGVSDEKT